MSKINIIKQGWVKQAELEAHKNFELELQKKFYNLYNGVIEKILNEEVNNLLKIDTKTMLDLMKFEEQFNKELDKLL